MIAASSYLLPPSFELKYSARSMSSPQTSTKRPAMKRKVEFATTFQVKVREYHSDEERTHTWYSSSDYATFGRDVKRTVRHIRKGRSFIGLSRRGLEKYFSSQYHTEKKRRELNHYRSILIEHQRQRSEGSYNPILLGMLSSVSSNWALQNALEFAKHDQFEASKCDDADEAVQVLDSDDACARVSLTR
jgi:hypothetical protein